MTRLIGCSMLYWAIAAVVALGAAAAGDCATGDLHCEQIGRDEAFWEILGFFALIYFGLVVGRVIWRRDAE